MGAGKTILIGAIVATEFAMALEHPGGPFIQRSSPSGSSGSMTTTSPSSTLKR
jgi:hypothetical protein